MPVEMTSGRPCARRGDQPVVGEVAAGDLVGVEPSDSSIGTTLSQNGVDSTASPWLRARATTARCASPSSSKVRKKSRSDAAFTCAGAGQPRRHELRGVDRLQLDGARTGRRRRVDQRERAVDEPPWFRPISAMANTGADGRCGGRQFQAAWLPSRSDAAIAGTSTMESTTASASRSARCRAVLPVDSDAAQPRAARALDVALQVVADAQAARRRDAKLVQRDREGRGVGLPSGACSSA